MIPASGSRTILGLLWLGTIAACSDPAGSEYLGIYDMQTFKGQTLPAGDGILHIRSAFLDLRDGGRFRLEMDRDFCGGAGQCSPDPVSHGGTFSAAGGILSLITEDGDRLQGRLQPGYIILEDGEPGSLWVLRE